MILGMDIWVFTAWILTILSALLCVLYGIYHWFLDRSDKKKSINRKNIISAKKGRK
jgi:hypothetical protein